MVPMVGVSIPIEPNKDPEALLSSFFFVNSHLLEGTEKDKHSKFPYR